ncbi:recombinase family protein [Gordonia terrae]
MARTLNEDGVPTRCGGKWAMTSVRNMLTNPRYCGRTFYYGGILECVRRHWEPLVPEEQFDLVQATLSDPLRKTRRAGTERKYLGSGLYRCDLCGAIVISWSNGMHRCSNACVHRSRNHIDTFVVDVITERLRRRDLAELLASGDDMLSPLLDETKRLRDRLATIDADYDAGHSDGCATARQWRRSAPNSPR